MLAVCFLVIFGLDMLTKIIFEGKYFSVIKGFIGVYSCHNTGAAFSIFAGKQLFLIIFTGIIFVGLLVFYIKFKQDNMLYIMSMSMIISGAVGNMFDRIFLGYVRDFINLEFMNFAIFNIADCALTIGIGLLVIYVLFFDTETKITKDKKENEAN